MSETKERKEEKKMPEIKAGYVVHVHQKIKEGNKERIQVFKGTVLAIKGKGKGRTITVRKISHGIGVEKIFPLFSPTIIKIEVEKKYKVRKAKAYYLRHPKAKKLKELK